VKHFSQIALVLMLVTAPISPMRDEPEHHGRLLVGAFTRWIDGWRCAVGSAAADRYGSGGSMAQSGGAGPTRRIHRQDGPPDIRFRVRFLRDPR